MRSSILAVLAWLLLIGPRPGVAQRAPTAYQHELSVLLGLGMNMASSAAGFASGPAYRFRIAPRVAGLAAIEATYFDRESAFLILVGAFVRTYRSIELIAGPGVRFVVSTPRDGGVAPADERTESIFRLGAGYRIETTNDYRVEPTVAIDVGGRSPGLVLGATFGIPF